MQQQQQEEQQEEAEVEQVSVSSDLFATYSAWLLVHGFAGSVKSRGSCSLPSLATLFHLWQPHTTGDFHCDCAQQAKRARSRTCMGSHRSQVTFYGSLIHHALSDLQKTAGGILLPKPPPKTNSDAHFGTVSDSTETLHSLKSLPELVASAAGSGQHFTAAFTLFDQHRSTGTGVMQRRCERCRGR